VVLEGAGPVLAPVLWVTGKMTDRLHQPATEDAPRQRRRVVTSDDISYMIKVGHREGSIPAHQAALLPTSSASRRRSPATS
jgi:hypothetical protein